MNKNNNHHKVAENASSPGKSSSKNSLNSVVSNQKVKIGILNQEITKAKMMHTDINIFRKIIAIFFALYSGVLFMQGIGSIIAGRPGVGLKMIATNWVLLFLYIYFTVCFCMVAMTIIGLPFAIILMGIAFSFLPLLLFNYFHTWLADIMICLTAK